MAQTLQPPPSLTPQQKESWNKFIDYVSSKKMNGHPSLDQRNMKVGFDLLQNFNKQNPKDSLPSDIVPKVQKELNDYRNSVLAKFKSGKAKIEGIKTEDDFMPGLSSTDGWPGTKTLSSKFPTASSTRTTPKGTTTKYYGTDVNAYDKDRGLAGMSYKK